MENSVTGFSQLLVHDSGYHDGRPRSPCGEPGALADGPLIYLDSIPKPVFWPDRRSRMVLGDSDQEMSQSSLRTLHTLFRSLRVPRWTSLYRLLSFYSVPPCI